LKREIEKSSSYSSRGGGKGIECLFPKKTMSITKQTEKYIQEHPTIKDCLKRGLINYSALARLIAKDADLDAKKNFDALLIAARRYQSKVKAEKSSQERILSVLKQSRIEIKNRMVAFVLEKDTPDRTLIDLENKIKKSGEIVHLIEGASAITLITVQEFSKEIKGALKHSIIRENQGLVEVVIKSPKEIETTAGIMGHLYSLLGENGINIVETMSCWTDTIFVVHEKDLNRVMELLKF
jgi:aspartokinase